MKELYPTPRVSIVLGITGHRDIRDEDEPAIRSTVAKLFLDFKNRFPHSPFRLLSSLAPGADQLIADVAEECGLEIMAPLPFPPELYSSSSTFEGSPVAAQTKLHGWLSSKRAKAWVVPFPQGPDSKDQIGWQKFVQDREKRHSCYANAGGYIARHCHVLIGLWDGEFSGANSGTEEIIEYKLHGKRPALFPWHEPLGSGDEIGPVYIIHTPRVGSKESPDHRPAPGELLVKIETLDYGVPSEELWWKPSLVHRLRQPFSSPSKSPLAAWRQFMEKMQAVDEFNRDISSTSHKPELRQRLESKKKSSVWHLSEHGRVPEELHHLLLLRETAAVLAAQLEGKFAKWQSALFFLVFLGVFIFDVYDHASLFGSNSEILSHKPVLVRLFLLAIGACLAIAGWVWSQRLNERRLDYRALAETLRVRIYWALAGIGISVADSYLGQLRGEISWARLTMKISAPPPMLWQERFQGQTPEHQLEQLRLVEKEWVNGQAKFYEDSFGKRRRAHAWFRVRGLSCVGLSLAIAVWLSLPDHGKHPPDVVLVLVNVLLLIGALLLLYSERQSNEDLAKQYERMTELFKAGGTELKAHLHAQPENIKAAQETIIALGKEAISEHSQWLILRRNRPFEVPVP
jgi:hypothetical protein